MFEARPLPDVLLPSEESARETDAQLLFPRRTIWAVYVSAVIVGGGLSLHHLFKRTALITPVDPNFHAFMVGVGVFIGVLLAAVSHDAWAIGIGVRPWRPAPRGLQALLALAVLVGMCGLGGDHVARVLAEWRAFHGLRPAAEDVTFRVVGRGKTRTGAWLDLETSAGAGFTIDCGDRIYSEVAVGDHLTLPVQTGRNGVQRALLPPWPQDLHRN